MVFCLKFELTILGCGAATPTLRRGSTAQLLNLHDRFLLIDCGEGTQLSLRKNRLKFQRINHIFISHLHGDHYLGLPGLVSSMHLLGRKNPLHIYCPAPLEEIMEMNMKYSDTFLNFEVIFHHHSTDGLHLILDEKQFEVYSFPMKHRIDCCGFLFKEKPKRRRILKEKAEQAGLTVRELVSLKNGEAPVREDGTIIPLEEFTLEPFPARSFAYCSDTAPFERQVEFIQGANLLYHESTFLEAMKDRAKNTFHSTAKQAATVASEASAGHLLLGHFSSRYDETREFVTEAREIFPNSYAASDGLRLEMGPEGELL